jgi:hypothetical protein
MSYETRIRALERIEKKLSWADNLPSRIVVEGIGPDGEVKDAVKIEVKKPR